MTPVERVARAFQDELRRQGVLYEHDADTPDPTCLMMQTGEAADLYAAIRAALAAMREPSEGMVEAAPRAGEWLQGAGHNGNPLYTPSLGGGPRDVWRAMIDAALGEG